MSDQQPEAVPAVGFLVMAFNDEGASDEVLKAMKEAKKQKQFYYENAAVIRQDAGGKIHYHETSDMKMGRGAGAGALIGGVIGILGGPAGVAAGATAGAALGALAAHGDAGFRDESLKTVGLALKPGTSAIAVITSEAFLRAVQKQVPVESIRGFVGGLAELINTRLNEGKNVALGLLLTEGGLAIKEVAVSETSAEVFGMVLTDDAVVAGQAVITEEGAGYVVMGATAEGAALEAGVVTAEGALLVSDVVTAEGETLTAAAVIPVEADEAPAAPETPAEDTPAAA